MAKRIVSKQEFVSQLGYSAGTSFFALILLFFCLIGILTTLALSILLTQTLGIVVLLMFTLPLGMGSLYLGYLG